MAASDEIMARWRRIEAKVKAVAEECRADPTQAELAYGIRLEVRRSDDAFRIFGGERTQAPQNERAAWLRATAAKLIPPQYQWEVLEMIGGGAALALKSVDEHSDDELGHGLARPPS